MPYSNRLLLFFATLLATSGASAQVQPRALKLSVDMSLFAHNRTLMEDEGISDTETVLSFGPTQATGGLVPGYVALSLGYVVHRHVIPQLTLGFGVTKLKSKIEGSEFAEENIDEDGPKLAELMLRPMVEVPINPDSKIVVSGLAGLDFRLLKVSYENSDFGEQKSKFRGIGPVLGLVTHFFVIERGSIDLGAQFSYRALKMKEGESYESDADKFNSISFGFTLGLSLWPGPDGPKTN